MAIIKNGIEIYSIAKSRFYEQIKSDGFDKCLTKKQKELVGDPDSIEGAAVLNAFASIFAAGLIQGVMKGDEEIKSKAIVID